MNTFISIASSNCEVESLTGDLQRETLAAEETMVLLTAMKTERSSRELQLVFVEQSGDCELDRRAAEDLLSYNPPFSPSRCS